MAFAIGSSLGGLAGAVYAPLVQFIEPNSFGLGMSFNLLLMVIVGGSGYFFGPFVGALVAVLLPEWMRITEGYYLDRLCGARDGDDGVLPVRHPRASPSACSNRLHGAASPRPHCAPKGPEP